MLKKIEKNLIDLFRCYSFLRNIRLSRMNGGLFVLTELEIHTSFVH